jgi:hypothetical protein
MARLTVAFGAALILIPNGGVRPEILEEEAVSASSPRCCLFAKQTVSEGGSLKFASVFVKPW